MVCVSVYMHGLLLASQSYWHGQHLGPSNLQRCDVRARLKAGVGCVWLGVSVYMFQVAATLTAASLAPCLQLHPTLWSGPQSIDQPSRAYRSSAGGEGCLWPASWSLWMCWVWRCCLVVVGGGSAVQKLGLLSSM